MCILDDTVILLNNNQEEAIAKIERSLKKMEGEKSASDQQMKELTNSINSLRNAFKGLQTNVRENKKRLSTFTETPVQLDTNISQSSSRYQMSDTAVTILEKNLEELNEKINVITTISIADLESESRISSLMDRG